MNIAISTTFNYEIPFEIMIPMIRQAGFDAVSLGGDNVGHSNYDKDRGRERIKVICKESGLFVDSIHAPFGKDIDISNLDVEAHNYSVNLVKQAIDACATIGCKILILHLNSKFLNKEFDNRFKTAQKSLEQIIRYAKLKEIFIAIENLSELNSMALFKQILGNQQHRNMGICYDTSHANLTGNLFSSMAEYSERIIAVHISDNKGQLDDHILPFEGIIDWEKFARHFALIDYKGAFLLEAEMRESFFKEPEVFLNEAYKRAMVVITLIKKCKDGK